jgi:phospholipid/cholesterol/gamma-HCH transport system substrate-binding protein
VAIIGVVLLYFGLKFLKGLTVFSSDSNYYVKFDNITGLSASSPVYANGFRVGVVEDIIYNYDQQDQIVAVVGLNKEMRLPKGSTAVISSDLLGNIKLELV